MYYRYEAKNEKGEWEGIFAFLDPSQRRRFSQYVKEPTWYKNNPDINSKCWFTELGYNKYHHIVEDLINEVGNLEIRLLRKNIVDNIVVKGTIQCIQVVEQKRPTKKKRWY